MLNRENIKIYDPAITKLNEYTGGAYQQSTSGLVTTNQASACALVSSRCLNVQCRNATALVEDASLSTGSSTSLAMTDTLPGSATASHPGVFVVLEWVLILASS